MPNLKDIRNRIKSVKSTQKITQAMRMVAAAKVKRAENRMKAARPYTSALYQLMTDVYNSLKAQAKGLSESRYAELLAPRPVKNIGIVVMSSDRGLCGNFNSGIIRQMFRVEKELKAQGLTPKFFLVGNKVIQSFDRYGDSPVLGRLGGISSAPSVDNASSVAESLTQAFLKGEIDAINILSTDFVSMISYKIHMTPVIPVKDQLPDYTVKLNLGSKYHTKDEVQEARDKALSKTIPPELLIEPDPISTLDTLLPMYISNLVYMQLLESTASELAARMTAMQNATKNAGEMISKLTLDYNKARQASITQELLEVVGGAEALQN